MSKFPFNDNITQQFDGFIGLDRVKARLRKVEAKVGLAKNTSTPIVTGSTAAAKTDSLIAALTELGLIDNQTT